MNNTNLHIFLGAGGVGKTTLSASYAMFLASKGKKVGLLSIDPAKRLKSALGEDISETGNIFWKSNNNGYLRAAILNLPDSLKRWIIDEGLSEEHQNQLFNHPLYTTLAEKIASATETLAPIRMAEWIEQYPETEDLIIDTAPGLHAVDFITRPDKLLAFFDSKILQWIKWFTGEQKWKWVNGKKQIIKDQNIFQKMLRLGAKTILNALASAGGENILFTMGEFILLMDQVFYKMVDRLEEARKWIRKENTKIYLISTLRDDSISVIIELKQILEKENIHNFQILLNRSFTDDFILSSRILEFMKDFEDKEYNYKTLTKKELLQRYIFTLPIIKKRILTKIKDFFNNTDYINNSIIEVPILSSINNYQKLSISDLVSLGSFIESNKLY